MRHVAMQRLRTGRADGGKQVRLVHDAATIIVGCGDIVISFFIFTF
jgi:hypothetical protein